MAYGTSHNARMLNSIQENDHAARQFVQRLINDGETIKTIEPIASKDVGINQIAYESDKVLYFFKKVVAIASSSTSSVSTVIIVRQGNLNVVINRNVSAYNSLTDTLYYEIKTELTDVQCLGILRNDGVVGFVGYKVVLV
jgi:hypothetical protein